MISWATRRRIIYFGSFSLFAISLFFLIFYFFFYKAPTCHDGRQNQLEEGIDCGGSCQTVCDFKTIKPLVLWSRYFKVVNGVYNVVALVENPNIKAEAFGVPYRFKVFDKNRILIAERVGKADLLPGAIIPIFESSVKTGNRIPSKNPYFEFTKKVKWIKTNRTRPNLSIKDKIFSKEEIGSQLRAVIINNSIKTVKNIELTAILSGQNGNAIAVSQTYIDSLERGNQKTIIFTWPEHFSKKVYRIEIIPLIMPLK